MVSGYLDSKTQVRYKNIITRSHYCGSNSDNYFLLVCGYLIFPSINSSKICRLGTLSWYFYSEIWKYYFSRVDWYHWLYTGRPYNYQFTIWLPATIKYASRPCKKSIWYQKLKFQDLWLNLGSIRWSSHLFSGQKLQYRYLLLIPAVGGFWDQDMFFHHRYTYKDK